MAPHEGEWLAPHPNCLIPMDLAFIAERRRGSVGPMIGAEKNKYLLLGEANIYCWSSSLYPTHCSN